MASCIAMKSSQIAGKNSNDAWNIMICHMLAQECVGKYSGDFDEVWATTGNVLEMGSSTVASWMLWRMFTVAIWRKLGSAHGANAFFSNGRQSMTSWCASSSNLPQIDRCWGKVTHFVSWCWAYSLSNVVSAVEGWLQKSDEDPETIFLWMCFFATTSTVSWRRRGPLPAEGLLLEAKLQVLF